MSAPNEVNLEKIFHPLQNRSGLIPPTQTGDGAAPNLKEADTAPIHPYKAAAPNPDEFEAVDPYKAAVRDALIYLSSGHDIETFILVVSLRNGIKHEAAVAAIAEAQEIIARQATEPTP